MFESPNTPTTSPRERDLGRRAFLGFGAAAAAAALVPGRAEAASAKALVKAPTRALSFLHTRDNMPRRQIAPQ